jgi:hypothetical protein
VSLETPAERENYDSRILQRLGIRVADYSVLNIHQIGIEAPTTFVWDALTRWRPDGGYWPNTIARAVFAGNRPDHVEVFLLGRRRSLFGLRSGFLGLDFVPLFQLDLLKSQAVPRATDVDNARFLLYRCSGGYPIGVFSIYVRSRIAAQREVEPTQLFFVVSFDFFGKKDRLGARAVRPIWESIHDRVTSHSVNRFKAHCEARFREVLAGRAQNS